MPAKIIPKLTSWRITNEDCLVCSSADGQYITLTADEDALRAILREAYSEHDQSLDVQKMARQLGMSVAEIEAALGQFTAGDAGDAVEIEINGERRHG